MKDKIFAICIWIFILLICCSPCLAEYSYVFEDLQLNPYDYARITDIDYTAIVMDEPGSEGSVLIRELVTFDVHAASKNNLFWELWRDLPEDYVDGVKVDYTVHSVKQILEDGTEIIYEESPKLYWDDYDYISRTYGPGKWYHSEGPYSESDAQYECVFFYVDGLYREKVTFEVIYEMHNAALRYNDCSDLYLAMYSGSTIEHLDSFKADIIFPDKDMPAPGNYMVYTYGTNSNDFPVQESATKYPGYYTFSMELDEKDLQFKPYNQYLEFDLVSYNEDRHLFTEYAPSNYYSSDDVLEEIIDEQRDYALTPDKFRVLKAFLLFAGLVIATAVLAYAFTVKVRMRKKHTFFEPKMNAEFYRDIPGDLDPNFAASLVFCKQKPPKDDSGVYSAILLSLARKEYIELQEIYNDLQINIKKKPAPVNPPIIQPLIPEPVSPVIATPVMETVLPPEPEKIYEPLTVCEQYYFNLLVRHAVNGSITMSRFQSRVSTDYSNTEAFARNMDNSTVNIGIKEGYLQKADYLQPKKSIEATAKTDMIMGILLITLVNFISHFTRLDYAFGSFFIMGIACIIASLYLKKQAPKYVLLTQFGEDEYVKWRGLYNFLNSDTLMHERTIIELPLWEKYLIYATAFGISEKVIEASRINCPEVSQSAVLSNSYCRSGRIHHSSRSFRSSVRSASFGGGGGFGYGGGGRGGGGGGGGH